MQIYLIAYERFFEGEVEVLTSLMKAYDFTFHLRKPSASISAYKQYLEAIPDEYHPRIMLHDAFELKDEFRLKGIHFATRNRDQRANYSGGVLSTSSHSLQEVRDLEAEYDYQFLSPVYPSISKPRYSGKLDLQSISDYLHGKRKGKLVALGGINSNKLDELARIGFDGIALLGSVWGNHPAEDRGIRDRFDEIYTLIKTNAL